MCVRVCACARARVRVRVCWGGAGGRAHLVNLEVDRGAGDRGLGLQFDLLGVQELEQVV